MDYSYDQNKLSEIIFRREKTASPATRKFLIEALKAGDKKKILAYLRASARRSGDLYAKNLSFSSLARRWGAPPFPKSDSAWSRIVDRVKRALSYYVEGIPPADDAGGQYAYIRRLLNFEKAMDRARLSPEEYARQAPLKQRLLRKKHPDVSPLSREGKALGMRPIISDPENQPNLASVTADYRRSFPLLSALQNKYKPVELVPTDKVYRVDQLHRDPAFVAWRGAVEPLTFSPDGTLETSSRWFAGNPEIAYGYAARFGQKFPESVLMELTSNKIKTVAPKYSVPHARTGKLQEALPITKHIASDDAEKIVLANKKLRRLYGDRLTRLNKDEALNGDYVPDRPDRPYLPYEGVASDLTGVRPKAVYGLIDLGSVADQRGPTSRKFLPPSKFQNWGHPEDDSLRNRLVRKYDVVDEPSGRPSFERVIRRIAKAYGTSASDVERNVEAVPVRLERPAADIRVEKIGGMDYSYYQNKLSEILQSADLFHREKTAASRWKTELLKKPTSWLDDFLKNRAKVDALSLGEIRKVLGNDRAVPLFDKALYRDALINSIGGPRAIPFSNQERKLSRALSRLREDKELQKKWTRSQRRAHLKDRLNYGYKNHEGLYGYKNRTQAPHEDLMDALRDRGNRQASRGLVKFRQTGPAVPAVETPFDRKTTAWRGISGGQGMDAKEAYRDEYFLQGKLYNEGLGQSRISYATRPEFAAAYARPQPMKHLMPNQNYVAEFDLEKIRPKFGNDQSWFSGREYLKKPWVASLGHPEVTKIPWMEDRIPSLNLHAWNLGRKNPSLLYETKGLSNDVPYRQLYRVSSKEASPPTLSEAGQRRRREALKIPDKTKPEAVLIPIDLQESPFDAVRRSRSFLERYRPEALEGPIDIALVPPIKTVPVEPRKIKRKRSPKFLARAAAKARERAKEKRPRELAVATAKAENADRFVKKLPLTYEELTERKKRLPDKNEARQDQVEQRRAEKFGPWKKKSEKENLRYLLTGFDGLF
jgi:hypothetical protein